jgi:hypothetical protein
MMRSAHWRAVVRMWAFENKRAQTMPSPLWKDRSGRLPGTALSITSSRLSCGSLPKRRTPGSLTSGQDPACANFSLPVIKNSVNDSGIALKRQPFRVKSGWVLVSQRRYVSCPILITALPARYVSGAIRSIPGLPGLPATKALAYVKTHLLRRAGLLLLLPVNHRK